jgi:ubiquinone/menaquinone biosynthesis C-methylase UbiE
MLPLCDTVLIACARQKPTTGKVSFRQGPAEAMPLPDGCADLVFMSMIYHHLNDPAAVARECHRVLRPGGYVCVRNGTRETDFPRRQSAIRRPATVQPPQYGINAANRPVSYSLSKSPCLLAPVPALIQTFLRAP